MFKVSGLWMFAAVALASIYIFAPLYMRAEAAWKRRRERVQEEDHHD